MSFYEWRPYESVASKRRKAEKELAKLRKTKKSIAPVTIQGTKIAKTFWGKSWCDNLERYRDFAYRLPRGRSYVRNGAVLDLQIAKGEIIAMVAGSEVYEIKIEIAPLSAPHWRAVCKDCTGSVDSLVELLQGRLAENVMRRVGREGDGLFPRAQGDQALLHLSRLGRYVQARRGHALWCRRPASTRSPSYCSSCAA